MKKNVLITMAIFASLLISCSAKNDCLTADTLKQIKSYHVNSHAYFIYARISEGQKKEAFFELYDNVPLFDECGKANIAVISSVRVDPAQGAVSKLVIDNNKLIIGYQKGHQENQRKTISFDSIPLEIKRR